jgi:hypothetical protein
MEPTEESLVWHLAYRIVNLIKELALLSRPMSFQIYVGLKKRRIHPNL